jgi:HAD superfamily hydrolase (TIGR01509 family)
MDDLMIPAEEDGAGIHALIFDFDGLILDTEIPAFKSWQEIFAEHGRTLRLEDWSVALGGSRAEFDTIGHLEEQLGRALDRDHVLRRRLRRKLELVAEQTVLPGVLEYLDDARRFELKLAVASSSPRSWVADHLERLGILERFDCVITSDDVERVKPNPDLFLAAAAALNVAPVEAIVFEDSPNGIAAARAAGIFCVAIPNALTAQLPIEADLRLASMAAMPLSTLLAIVERHLAAGARQRGR